MYVQYGWVGEGFCLEVMVKMVWDGALLLIGFVDGGFWRLFVQYTFLAEVSVCLSMNRTLNPDIIQQHKLVVDIKTRGTNFTPSYIRPCSC